MRASISTDTLFSSDRFLSKVHRGAQIMSQASSCLTPTALRMVLLFRFCSFCCIIAMGKRDSYLSSYVFIPLTVSIGLGLLISIIFFNVYFRSSASAISTSVKGFMIFTAISPISLWYCTRLLLWGQFYMLFYLVPVFFISIFFEVVFHRLIVNNIDIQTTLYPALPMAVLTNVVIICELATTKAIILLVVLFALSLGFMVHLYRDGFVVLSPFFLLAFGTCLGVLTVKICLSLTELQSDHALLLFSCYEVLILFGIYVRCCILLRRVNIFLKLASQSSEDALANHYAAVGKHAISGIFGLLPSALTAAVLSCDQHHRTRLVRSLLSLPPALISDAAAGSLLSVTPATVVGLDGSTTLPVGPLNEMVVETAGGRINVEMKLMETENEPANLVVPKPFANPVLFDGPFTPNLLNTATDCFATLTSPSFITDIDTAIELSAGKFAIPTLTSLSLVAISVGVFTYSPGMGAKQLLQLLPDMLDIVRPSSRPAYVMLVRNLQDLISDQTHGYTRSAASYNTRTSPPGGDVLRAQVFEYQRSVIRDISTAQSFLSYIYSVTSPYYQPGQPIARVPWAPFTGMTPIAVAEQAAVFHNSMLELAGSMTELFTLCARASRVSALDSSVLTSIYRICLRIAADDRTLNVILNAITSSSSGVAPDSSKVRGMDAVYDALSNSPIMVSRHTFENAVGFISRISGMTVDLRPFESYLCHPPDGDFGVDAAAASIRGAAQGLSYANQLVTELETAADVPDSHLERPSERATDASQQNPNEPTPTQLLVIRVPKHTTAWVVMAISFVVILALLFVLLNYITCALKMIASTPAALEPFSMLRSPLFEPYWMWRDTMRSQYKLPVDKLLPNLPIRTVQDTIFGGEGAPYFAAPMLIARNIIGSVKPSIKGVHAAYLGEALALSLSLRTSFDFGPAMHLPIFSTTFLEMAHMAPERRKKADSGEEAFNINDDNTYFVVTTPGNKPPCQNCNLKPGNSVDVAPRFAETSPLVGRAWHRVRHDLVSRPSSVGFYRDAPFFFTTVAKTVYAPLISAEISTSHGRIFTEESSNRTNHKLLFNEMLYTDDDVGVHRVVLPSNVYENTLHVLDLAGDHVMHAMAFLSHHNIVSDMPEPFAACDNVVCLMGLASARSSHFKTDQCSARTVAGPHGFVAGAGLHENPDAAIADHVISGLDAIEIASPSAVLAHMHTARSHTHELTEYFITFGILSIYTSIFVTIAASYFAFSSIGLSARCHIYTALRTAVGRVVTRTVLDGIDSTNEPLSVRSSMAGLCIPSQAFFHACMQTTEIPHENNPEGRIARKQHFSLVQRIRGAFKRFRLTHSHIVVDEHGTHININILPWLPVIVLMLCSVIISMIMVDEWAKHRFLGKSSITYGHSNEKIRNMLILALHVDHSHVLYSSAIAEIADAAIVRQTGSEPILEFHGLARRLLLARNEKILDIEVTSAFSQIFDEMPPEKFASLTELLGLSSFEYSAFLGTLGNISNESTTCPAGGAWMWTGAWTPYKHSLATSGPGCGVELDGIGCSRDIVDYDMYKKLGPMSAAVVRHSQSGNLMSDIFDGSRIQGNIGISSRSLNIETKFKPYSGFTTLTDQTVLDDITLSPLSGSLLADVVSSRASGLANASVMLSNQTLETLTSYATKIISSSSLLLRFTAYLICIIVCIGVFFTITYSRLIYAIRILSNWAGDIQVKNRDSLMTALGAAKTHRLQYKAAYIMCYLAVFVLAVVFAVIYMNPVAGISVHDAAALGEMDYIRHNLIAPMNSGLLALGAAKAFISSGFTTDAWLSLFLRQAYDFAHRIKEIDSNYLTVVPDDLLVMIGVSKSAVSQSANAILCGCQILGHLDCVNSLKPWASGASECSVTTPEISMQSVISKSYSAISVSSRMFSTTASGIIEHMASEIASNYSKFDNQDFISDLVLKVTKRHRLQSDEHSLSTIIMITTVICVAVVVAVVPFCGVCIGTFKYLKCRSMSCILGSSTRLHDILTNSNWCKNSDYMQLAAGAQSVLPVSMRSYTTPLITVVVGVVIGTISLYCAKTHYEGNVVLAATSVSPLLLMHAANLAAPLVSDTDRDTILLQTPSNMPSLTSSVTRFYDNLYVTSASSVSMTSPFPLSEMFTLIKEFKISSFVKVYFHSTLLQGVQEAAEKNLVFSEALRDSLTQRIATLDPESPESKSYSLELRRAEWDVSVLTAIKQHFTSRTIGLQTQDIFDDLLLAIWGHRPLRFLTQTSVSTFDESPQLHHTVKLALPYAVSILQSHLLDIANTVCLEFEIMVFVAIILFVCVAISVFLHYRYTLSSIRSINQFIRALLGMICTISEFV